MGDSSRRVLSLMSLVRAMGISGLTALGVPVALLAAALDVVLVAGTAAVILMSIVPFSALVFGWAALLPIWTIGPIDPLVFDALRLIGAFLILVRGSRQPAQWREALNGWAAPLIALALITAVVA